KGDDLASPDRPTEIGGGRGDGAMTRRGGSRRRGVPPSGPCWIRAGGGGAWAGTGRTCARAPQCKTHWDWGGEAQVPGGAGGGWGGAEGWVAWPHASRPGEGRPPLRNPRCARCGRVVKCHVPAQRQNVSSTFLGHTWRCLVGEAMRSSSTR